MSTQLSFSRNPAASLQNILGIFFGSKLLDIVVGSNGENIRIDLDTRSANNKEIKTPIIRVVLLGNPSLHYSSYTETTAVRRKISDPDLILSNELELQGAIASGPHTLVLFCRSSQAIAAGELHLSFTNFTLYDEEYGWLDITSFIT